MREGHTALINVDHTRTLWRKTEFAWGVSDCIMSVCDAVLAATGVDPARPWRGDYDTERGAQAIYEAQGGVLGLFDYGMARAGFALCGARSGLPVVVRFGGHEIAGICTGGRVMMRLEGRGVIETRADILGAWE